MKTVLLLLCFVVSALALPALNFGRNIDSEDPHSSKHLKIKDSILKYFKKNALLLPLRENVMARYVEDKEHESKIFLHNWREAISIYELLGYDEIFLKNISKVTKELYNFMEQNHVTEADFNNISPDELYGIDSYKKHNFKKADIIFLQKLEVLGVDKDLIDRVIRLMEDTKSIEIDYEHKVSKERQEDMRSGEPKDYNYEEPEYLFLEKQFLGILKNLGMNKTLHNDILNISRKIYLLTKGKGYSPFLLEVSSAELDDTSTSSYEEIHPLSFRSSLVTYFQKLEKIGVEKRDIQEAIRVMKETNNFILKTLQVYSKNWKKCLINLVFNMIGCWTNVPCYLKAIGEFIGCFISNQTLQIEEQL